MADEGQILVVIHPQLYDVRHPIYSEPMPPRLMSYFPVLTKFGALLLGVLSVAIDVSGLGGGFHWDWLLGSSFFVYITVDVYERVQNFIAARPRVVLDRYFVDQRPWDIMNTGERLAILYFAHADFKNDPKLREPDAKAKDVVAHLSYFHADGITLATGLESFYGRWAHKAQAATVGQYGSVANLLPTDMDVSGRPYTLTLALKYPEDDVCYVWDNELPRLEDLRRDWRYRLQGECFRVGVHLTGERVDEKFWLTIRNLGPGGGLEVDLWQPPHRPVAA